MNTTSSTFGSASVAPQPLAVASWVGDGLVRPECVLTNQRGELFTADWRSGVAHIHPNGAQSFYAAQTVDGEVLQPNGIALRRDGSFLLAHLGAELGGFSACKGTVKPGPCCAKSKAIDCRPPITPWRTGKGVCGSP